jgi:hypothetical protein
MCANSDFRLELSYLSRNRTMNPLLSHELVLEPLVSRFGFTSVGAFYVTLILVPGVLFLWSWYDKTLAINRLHDNPHGFGFLSAIDLWMIVLPFLNYAVLSCYDHYHLEVQALLAIGIISPNHDNPLLLFVSWRGYVTTIAAYVVSFGLAIIAVTWDAHRRGPRYNSWLSRNGQARPVSYYFHFSVFGIQLGILFNWIFRHLWLWQSINRGFEISRFKVFHTDHLFGLAPLASLTSYAFFVVLLLAILVVTWLVGARITRIQEPLFTHPGHSVAVGALFLLGPVLILLPLGHAHILMEQFKINALIESSIASGTLSDKVESATVSDDAKQSEYIKRLNNLKQLEKFIEETSTWPLPPNVIPAGITYLGTLASPLVVEFIVTLIKKRRVTEVDN